MPRSAAVRPACAGQVDAPRPAADAPTLLADRWNAHPRRLCCRVLAQDQCQPRPSPPSPTRCVARIETERKPARRFLHASARDLVLHARVCGHARCVPRSPRRPTWILRRWRSGAQRLPIVSRDSLLRYFGSAEVGYAIVVASTWRVRPRPPPVGLLRTHSCSSLIAIVEVMLS